MEPEFAIMLSYLQELPFRQKPNYKMIRNQFEVMKERHHLKYILEWNEKPSSSPRSDNLSAMAQKPPVLHEKKKSSAVVEGKYNSNRSAVNA